MELKQFRINFERTHPVSMLGYIYIILLSSCVVYVRIRFTGLHMYTVKIFLKWLFIRNSDIFLYLHWTLTQETDFIKTIRGAIKIVIGQRAYTFGGMKKILIKSKNKEIHIFFGQSLIMIRWNMSLAN